MSFEQHMNPPETPKQEAYISYDKKIRRWVTCPYCGKKQFIIGIGTKIENLLWKCKGSNCKCNFKINI